MELQELIHEAKKGSRAAEGALFKNLSKRYLCFCMRYVENADDARERMSDGFFKFFRSLHRFNYESDEEVHSYISTIMTNVCLSFLRKKKVLNIVSEPLETDSVLDEDALDKISTEEIHTMIRKLPEGARTIFNLSVLEGYMHEEIAGIMQITPGGSRAQLTRARQLLQSTLSFLKKDNENKETR